MRALSIFPAMLAFAFPSTEPSRDSAIAPTDVVKIKISDWAEAAEKLDRFLEYSNQFATTRELSIDISVPFDEADEISDLPVVEIFNLYANLPQNRIRAPPRLVEDPSAFIEHGLVEYYHRQQDFDVHQVVYGDPEELDIADLQRFNFLLPFESAWSQPDLVAVAPPANLLVALAKIVSQMPRLETVKFNMNTPKEKIIDLFRQAFIAENVTLTSVKHLHLSAGMEWLVPLAPNLESIISRHSKFFSHRHALNLINAATNASSLQTIALRTRWDEALISSCPNVTSLHLYGSTRDGFLETSLRHLQRLPNLQTLVIAESLLVPQKFSGIEAVRRAEERAVISKIFSRLPSIQTVRIV